MLRPPIILKTHCSFMFSWQYCHMNIYSRLSLSVEKEKKDLPSCFPESLSSSLLTQYLSSSHVRLSHPFSLLFDLPFINRQYVYSPRGEQALLAVYGASPGCNGPSGSPASIQLNNQIIRRLCPRLISLCKSSPRELCVAPETLAWGCFLISVM